MRTFDLWFDIDNDMYQFGENEADAIARNLEMIAKEIRNGRLRPDGKFTQILKPGAATISEESIVGAYRVK